jgi:hypothetical protein
MFETINQFDTFSPSNQAEGLPVQARQELQEVKQLEREEQERLQTELNREEQLATQPQPNQPLIKLHFAELAEQLTEKVTSIKDLESYLEARSVLFETLKTCQKMLEWHEEKTLIPRLEQEQNRTIKVNKWQLSYKPSQKTAIDINKLKAALSNPEHVKYFFKKPEFKPMNQCKDLLLKLGVYGDVYTTKTGKKPILHITDTNTVRRKAEEIDLQPEEEDLSREEQIYN